MLPDATPAEGTAPSDDAGALVLAETKRFLRARVDAAANERAGRLPPTLLAEAGALGLYGLAVPEAYGGLGLGLGGTASIIEEIACVDRSLATSVGLHNGLGLQPLIRHGTEEARKAWLPALATGEAIAAFAATEPQAGSDLGAVRTTLSSEAGGLRLEGEKAFVTNGGLCAVVTVLARSPGLGGMRAHTMALVPMDRPGVRRGAEEHKLGLRASSTTSLTFADVRLPFEALLGPPGAGLTIAHETLAWGRTLMAAGCVGTARAAVDATLRHVAERRQFGRRLLEFEAVRLAVADMAASLVAMRALVAASARAVDTSGPAAITSAMAKVFASERAFAVCDAAIQLHGALGFMEETGIPRLLRDCRVTRIFEGANDVLLQRIALDTLMSGHAVHAATQGAGAPAALDAAAAKVDQAAADLKARFGIRVGEQQALLGRLGRAITLVHAAAALARTGTDDGPLDTHAIRGLATAAQAELDAMPSQAADTAQANAVCEHLLGQDFSTRGT